MKKRQGDKDPIGLQEYVQKFNELEMVFNNMPSGVFAILDKRLNIATINKTASGIIGVNSQQVIGRNTREVFESRFPGIQRLIDETIKNKRPIKNFTLEIEDGNGEINIYLISTAIKVGSDPSEYMIVLVLHDISETARLRKVAMSLQSFGPLVGRSTAMKETYFLIETVAKYDTTVLIYGETGTGKELAARAIHESSPRSGGPFVPVSCSALVSSLLESELFGHVRGAFTGAIENRMGRFEIARKGTIFLDEVGSMTLDIQAKLLRTLQEKIIYRVGSSEQIPIDVRVISATNRDLTELIAKGEFREDLYYRLKVFQINLPPLRERCLDVPILAEHFIGKFNNLYNRRVIGLTSKAKEILMKYFWPGNVRELENAIEHALVLAPGNIISPQYFPPEIRHMKSNGRPPLRGERSPDRMEEDIRFALTTNGWNINRTAANLGMHRITLWRKMKEFGIKRPDNISVD
ncbi:MAG: sigma 54-interacting transcriptional regulator [Pseudomonadota bacterium]